jgi:DNA-binding transcriptional MerR regulator
VRANASTTRSLHSGELARLAGISADTLRFYERRGLLPAAPRTASGYRLFPLGALTRVRLIRGALFIGFSVAELAAILRERDRGGAPCRHVRALMRSKIRDVDQQIRNLVSLRVELNRLSKEWDKRLRRTKPGQVARLLEAVPPKPGTRVASGFPRLRKKKGQ